VGGKSRKGGEEKEIGGEKKMKEERRRSRGRGGGGEEEKARLRVRNPKTKLIYLYQPELTGTAETSQNGPEFFPKRNRGLSYRFTYLYEIFRSFWPEQNGIDNIGLEPTTSPFTHT
jgi:hypothetical protein